MPGRGIGTEPGFAPNALGGPYFSNLEDPTG